MYYGVYADKAIPMGSGLVYKMPLAYLCVGGGYLLLCLAIMVFRYIINCNYYEIQSNLHHRTLPKRTAQVTDSF